MYGYGTMSKYRLESLLSIIADKYENLESELQNFTHVWDYLMENYTGNPPENLKELLGNEKDITELCEIIGIDK